MKDKGLEPVFHILEHTFAALGIDYYLIGAMARQIWYEKADMHFRTTRDIDYAVLMGSQKEYQKVKKHLVEMEGYIEAKENVFALKTPDGIQIDMLPFGEIESDGSVEIKGMGMTSINVAGMKEVYESGTQEMKLNTGNLFKVATLPSIVLLKLIAYNDRPELRQKDAGDIGNILIHFFHLQENLIYDQHNDLFGEEERSLESIGAIVIGREMNRIVKGNDSLKDRLNTILKGHIKESEKSDFNRLMVRETQKDLEKIISYLVDMLWGFQNFSAVGE